MLVPRTAARSGAVTVAAAVLLCFAAGAAQPPLLTPAQFGTLLAARPAGAEAEALADKTRAWFGTENLKRGPNPKVDELSVAWAVEAPGLAPDALPEVAAVDGSFRLRLARIGDTDVYGARTLLPEGSALRWVYQLPDGKRLGEVRQLEVYRTHPDSVAQPGVPQGTLT